MPFFDNSFTHPFSLPMLQIQVLVFFPTIHFNFTFSYFTFQDFIFIIDFHFNYPF